MNIELQMHRYQLPLVCPLQLAGEELVAREGWLVECRSNTHAVGWGEIAPLAGVSSPEELSAIDDWSGERLEGTMVTPSVRCGLDMALFNLGDPDLMPAILKNLTPRRRQVSVNALLIGTVEDMLKQERAAVLEGYRTIKIKVGRQDVATELEMLRDINNQADAGLAFRFDVNRAWTPEIADRYLSVLSLMNVEYIEEPFEDPRASLVWSRATGVPVALDESLRDLGPEGLADYAGLRAVVLKPMVLGGLCRSMEFVEAARAIGAYPVVSAIMESGIGTLTLAKFAACLNQDDVAVGLDTYRWLANDMITPRPDMKGGVIHADQWDLSRYTFLVD
jgi:O-succinylbenzoate synthase